MRSHCRFAALLGAWLLCGCVSIEPATYSISELPVEQPTETVTFPSSTATSPVDDIEPPPATLEINGSVQTSGIGTFCWSNESGGLCADMIGVPTQPDPIITSSPIQAQLHLPLEEPPSNLELQIMPVDETSIDVGPRNYRWWDYQDQPSGTLPLISEQAIDLSLEPGLYVLRITAWWDGEGDVTYGFLLQVES